MKHLKQISTRNISAHDFVQFSAGVVNCQIAFWTIQSVMTEHVATKHPELVFLLSARQALLLQLVVPGFQTSTAGETASTGKEKGPNSQ